MSQQVIAIDGPAASGKSTIAALLAAKLHIPYINTGNMYRAITMYALDSGIHLETECTNEVFTTLLNTLKLDYIQTVSGDYELQVNGILPGPRLRSPEVAAFVSPVAVLSVVRDWLKDLQRDSAKLGLIVMEGRDIGTVIFPDAAFKFFLTATPEERARRRLAQAGETFDGATLESVARDIAERDHIDSSRAIAPLKPADDSEIVDTTEMTIDEVINYLAGRVNNASS
jgi:CMP/dCMP kinase